MDSGTENPRGVHAIRVLDGKKGFTIDSLIGTADDSYMPEFDIQIPLLLKAHGQAAASNPLQARVAEQIAVLKDWDSRWSAASVPTSVAIFCGEDLWQRLSPEARKAGMSVYDYMRTKATAQQRLESLAAATDKLQADFGKWQTPWGDINRFQRNDASIVQKFDDTKPTTPVMFASARWGSLASLALGLIRAPRSGTAPAATALSRWSSRRRRCREWLGGLFCRRAHHRVAARQEGRRRLAAHRHHGPPVLMGRR